jgi:hypothetical protein
MQQLTVSLSKKMESVIEWQDSKLAGCQKRRGLSQASFGYLVVIYSGCGLVISS